MPLTRSDLPRLLAPDAFLWCTGVEDTFITAVWPATGRTLDEYELTQHYEQWRQDIGLMAELGVPAARYGLPWHRIHPAPRQWDWDFADRTLEYMLERRIDPIVDLVHYGTPPWMENAFLNPDFPAHMAEYAGRVAERYAGRVHAYTPLNEPRITAWYCGKLGWWPPCKRGWSGFVRVMLSICRGIVETTRALDRVDSEILAVHVDATDLFEAEDRSAAPEAELRQEVVFLALDLITGRVTPTHSLWEWLIRNGASADDLEWFSSRAIDLPVVGINLYPMFSFKRLSRKSGRLRVRMPYASGEIVERLARLYWERYQRPILITETASLGSAQKRRQWLDESVAACARVREQGIPLIGYTWWPLFALVAWAYRQGRRPVSDYLLQMGLWDLRADDAGKLVRVRTPLADAYRSYVERGAAQVSAFQPAGAPA